MNDKIADREVLRRQNGSDRPTSCSRPYAPLLTLHLAASAHGNGRAAIPGAPPRCCLNGSRQSPIFESGQPGAPTSIEFRRSHSGGRWLPIIEKLLTINAIISIQRRSTNVPSERCSPQQRESLLRAHAARACVIVWFLMRIFTSAWCAFWITIKLNKVFIMFCDPVCQISGSARSEACIRDDLLAFDREARFPIRPN